MACACERECASAKPSSLTSAGAFEACGKGESKPGNLFGADQV